MSTAETCDNLWASHSGRGKTLDSRLQGRRCSKHPRTAWPSRTGQEKSVASKYPPPASCPLSSQWAKAFHHCPLPELPRNPGAGTETTITHPGCSASGPASMPPRAPCTACSQCALHSLLTGRGWNPARLFSLWAGRVTTHWEHNGGNSHIKHGRGKLRQSPASQVPTEQAARRDSKTHTPPPLQHCGLPRTRRPPDPLWPLPTHTQVQGLSLQEALGGQDGESQRGPPSCTQTGNIRSASSPVHSPQAPAPLGSVSICHTGPVKGPALRVKSPQPSWFLHLPLPQAPQLSAARWPRGTSSNSKAPGGTGG